ncbi:MAG: DUF2384 domain-containing protein [Deltaproteobacteria bacterium]|nr:MAG: DUF2384 domain-containing protein [Deltaproteobacteria bacterium]
METNIFSSIPSNDRYLSMFFHRNQPDYDKIRQVLNFNKKEIAAAAHVPLESVRNDNRISKELLDRLKEWAVLLGLVAEYFEGNTHKIELWFRMPNPLLGNISPRDMIRFGRFKKLHQFIQNALHENKHS